VSDLAAIEARHRSWRSEYGDGESIPTGCSYCGSPVSDSEWPCDALAAAARLHEVEARLQDCIIESKAMDDTAIALGERLREVEAERAVLLDAISLSMPALLEAQRAMLGLERHAGDGLLALERAMLRLERAYDEVSHGDKQ
jgi:hypothetical protein